MITSNMLSPNPCHIQFQIIFFFILLYVTLKNDLLFTHRINHLQCGITTLQWKIVEINNSINTRCSHNHLDSWRSFLRGGGGLCAPFITGSDKRLQKCTDRNRRQYPEDVHRSTGRGDREVAQGSTIDIYRMHFIMSINNNFRIETRNLLNI